MTSLNFRKINIESYKPGRSVLKKKKNVIKLSANESALGMSPKVLKILQSKNYKISKYPDSKAVDLRKLISSKFKCDFNKIICGSGSDEIIQMICQLFLKSGDEVIVPQYSFLMYRIYASIVGAKVVFSKEKKFRVSVENIIKKVNKKTKIVFIANPNNPTGTYLEKKELINLRKKLNKKILLVVDDAYDEYMKDKKYSSGLKIFKNKKNVIKLSANESALGMSPKVLKILQNKNYKISKYPDSKAIDLRKIISLKFKCDFNKIICGSGSDEVIQMICQLFLKSGDEVIVPQYSFLMYRISVSYTHLTLPTKA